MSSIILIIVGILLIVLNLNAVLKEKRSFQSQLYVKQNNMEDYKVEIGKVRKEFSETVFELQKEIESLKDESKDGIAQVMLYNGAGKKTTENPNSSSENVKVKVEHNIKEIVENKVKDSGNKDKDSITQESKESKNLINNQNEDDNNIKIHKIRNLLENGMNVNEISEKTGIDKGEVLLIKELYTK